MKACHWVAVFVGGVYTTATETKSTVLIQRADQRSQIGKMLREFGFRRKVAGCAKHYVGDGGTTHGINENNTVISQEGLMGIHMPASIRLGKVSPLSWFHTPAGLERRFPLTGILSLDSSRTSSNSGRARTRTVTLVIIS